MLGSADCTRLRYRCHFYPFGLSNVHLCRENASYLAYLAAVDISTSVSFIFVVVQYLIVGTAFNTVCHDRLVFYISIEAYT